MGLLVGPTDDRTGAAIIPLAAIIVVSTVVGVVWVPRMRVKPTRQGGWLRHPGLWLSVVVALMFVNQVLFTAYVDKRWNGDPTPIARYLPAGWFDLADLGSITDVLPAWSPTVLHIQAALELPFVVLAYLLVCRWFGTDVFARVVAARWVVSVSFTATFCLIEWDLHNPYTVTDIVIRVLSGVVLPLFLPLLSAGRGGPPAPVAFAASAGALGCVVLAVYDTVTLYNLAHVPEWLPLVAGALAVLAIARWWALRPVNLRPVTGSAVSSLGWFLVLFVVPALPLRYGFNFGSAYVSMVAGVVIVVGALWRGWDRGLIAQFAAAAAAGGVGASIGVVVARGYPEATLLAAAGGFVLAAVAACGAMDHWMRSQGTDQA